MKRNRIATYAYEGEVFRPGEAMPRYHRARRVRAFNVSTFKVGGIRFIKLGRINIALSVSREYRA